jgi:hypothetical protein
MNVRTGVDSATGNERLDRLQSAVEDAMTELMQLRERVEGFVVPELQRQGKQLATVLADLNDAGASKRGGTDARKRRTSR